MRKTKPKFKKFLLTKSHAFAEKCSLENEENIAIITLEFTPMDYKIYGLETEPTFL